MSKFNDLLNDKNSFKLVKQLDGKPVRLLMDNDKSFKLIDSKTGKSIKVLMDDDKSFKLVTNKSIIMPNDKSFKLVNNDLKITLKNGKSIKLSKNSSNKKIKFVSGEEEKNKNKSKFEIFFTEKSFNLLEILVTIVLVVAAMLLVTDVLKDDKDDNKSSLNEYESIIDPNLTEFIDLYTKINENYYKDIDSGEMLDKITEAMLEYLGDTYSSYIDEAQARNLMDELNGKYEGLGLQISTDDNKNLVIVNIFEKSNAYNSGLKAGDIITEVAGIDVTKKDSSEVSLLIKDKLSGVLTVKVKRGKEELEFAIKKGTVIIDSVTSQVMDKVGYVKIDTFSAMTANQVAEAIKSMNEESIERLVIDVRYNTGGYLDAAYNVANLFVEKGKTIYQLKTSEETTKYTAKTGNKFSYPVAILMNGTSASASEVFALAMRDSYGAKLVGAKSYGKGTVQETSKLSTGALVKYTIANWLGPKGENIDGVGIKPDVDVSMGSLYMKEPTQKNDKQLQEAIKVVSE